MYAKPEKQPMQLRKKLTAVVTNMGQLDAVLQARGICRVYYEAAADLEKNLDKILAKMPQGRRDALCRTAESGKRVERGSQNSR